MHRRRRSPWILVAVLGLAVAALAVLHSAPGRLLVPAFARSEAAAGCPLGFGRGASPEARAAARARHVGTSTGAARARPALGFSLDRTTRADVLAWARGQGVRCGPSRGLGDLECAGVAGRALPAPATGPEGEAPLDALWLEFDSGDRLVMVSALRKPPTAAAAHDVFTALTTRLAREAGPAASFDGRTSAELAAGPLRQASAVFRFRDYYATVRATNLGQVFVVTEEYRTP